MAVLELSRLPIHAWIRHAGYGLILASVLPVAAPVLAQAPTGRWTALALGDRHTCGLAADSTAWCWGDNDQSQLGDGTRVNRYQPVRVTGDHRFASLATGGEHTCGLTADGTALCWGNTASGRAEGRRGNRGTPLDVPNLRFTVLALAGSTTCGLTVANATLCWGSYTGDLRPEPVGAARRYAAILASDYTVCGAEPPATLTCRDLNGAVRTVTIPGGLAGSPVGGYGHACALTRDGAALCWGQNSAGQLGDGTTTRRSEPGPVVGAPRFVSLAAGGNRACGLTADGAAYCWGERGRRNLRPVRIASPVPFASIAVGATHYCGLTASGEAYCWGENAAGQLGDGSTTERQQPAPVLSPWSGAVASVAGPPEIDVAERSDRSTLILPSGYDGSRPIPVVVFFPPTDGTAAGLFSGYVAEVGNPALHEEPLSRQLDAVLDLLFPRRDRRHDLAILLAPGNPTEDAYLTGAAWSRTVTEFERRVLADLAEFQAAYRLDTTRIALAGYSLGGDLSWALALRNPGRFRGAIAMGSRAAYRTRASEQRALAERGARFFFALGAREDPDRLAGARAAARLLDGLGVPYRFREIPAAGHVRAPPAMLAEALTFVLWER